MTSIMQEAAIELLDAAIVSCPPYCRRRTRPVPMAAKADDPPHETEEGTAVVNWKRSLPWQKSERRFRVAEHPLTTSDYRDWQQVLSSANATRSDVGGK